MSEQREPDVRHMVPFGWATCTKVDSERPTEPQCGRPARWHVMWNLHDPVTGWKTALSCHEHYFRDRQFLEAKDDHEFGGACGMPGALWQFGHDGKPSCCVIPLEDVEETTATVSEIVSEPVGAGV